MARDELITESSKVLLEKLRNPPTKDLDFIDLTPKDLTFDELIPPRRASLAQRIGDVQLSLMTPPLRELPRIGADVASSFTLGLFPPKSFIQQLPPVTTLQGQATDILGQGVGLIRGPAGAAGKFAGTGLSRLIPGLTKTILGRATQRAVEGATIGAVSDVTNPPQDISRRAQLGAGVNVLLPPLLQRAVKDVRAVSLLNRIGPVGSSRSSATRAEFLTPIQEEALAKPRLSGREVGERIASLNAQFPERQQVLGQVIPQAINSINEQFSQNPSLVKAVLKSAEDSGRLPLIKSIFPETELGFEQAGMAPEDVVTAGRVAFRRRMIQEMRTQGLLPAELRPQNMTFDHVQQLKRVFGDIIDQSSRSLTKRITQTDVEVAEAYGTLREAELAVHPELKEAFTTHRGVMNSFRTVKPLISNLDKFEGLLKGLEGGTAGEQRSLERLLVPSSFLKAQTFSDALQFQKGIGTIARRAVFYTSLFPLYTLFSLIRSDLFREARRK